MHEKLLNHLGISSVHILAHDLGDTVAQEMLARYDLQTNSEQLYYLVVDSLMDCLADQSINWSVG